METEFLEVYGEHGVTIQVHLWANLFFDYLYKRGWSPKLTALVIGCYMPDDDDNEGLSSFQQHCFVRGLQVDMLGRSTAVAVPVTRAMLRAAEPYANILDYDPESDWIGALGE